MAKLNVKQELFCQEYIIDLNATQAAVRAGYSEKTASATASRLLANVKVSSRIKELKDKRADKLELDAFWVLKRLKEVSDRSMQAEPVMEFRGGEMIETGEYEFDSTGANRATELIGKHIGMFDPKLRYQLDALDLSNERTKLEIQKLEKELQTETSTEDKLSELIRQNREVLNNGKD